MIFSYNHIVDNCKEPVMLKSMLAILCVLSVSACATAGRTVQGIGEDVKRGTDYVSDMLLPNQTKK